MGLSWAEAANYAQHAELCHIRFLSGKTWHWGPPFSHFFLSMVALFWTFLMILQSSLFCQSICAIVCCLKPGSKSGLSPKCAGDTAHGMCFKHSPNDGGEGTAHVLLWGVWNCQPLAGEDGDSPAAWGSATKVQAATGKLSVFEYQSHPG